LFYYEEKVVRNFSLLSILSLALFSGNILAAGGHGGHKGGNSGSGRACTTTVIDHIKPANKAKVSPETEISFWVKGITDPSLVAATAKKLPLTLDAEVKTGVIVYTAKLPASLVDTAARILVKVSHKKCPAEKGWLLLISE